jgi:hypothetical protein
MPTRRSFARTLAFVVAALAVAGTSASPPPAPIATQNAQGALELTADRPIASTILTLDANQAARSVPQTAVRTRLHLSPAAGTDATSVVAIIEPLEGEARSPTVGSTVDVTGVLVDPCPTTQTCSSRFRVTAVLLDPDAERASIAWGASIQVDPFKDPGASIFPADARLTAAADPPTTRPAADLARAAVDPESIHLDPGHPGTSRVVEPDHPPGESMSADAPWFAYLTLADPAPDPSGPFRLEVRGTRLADQGPVFGQAFAGLTAFRPSTCPTADRCASSIRLDLGLPGGMDPTQDVDWSIGVVAIGADGATPAPVAVRVPDRLDPGPDAPHLTVTVAGSADVVRGTTLARAPILTLDASEVAQAAGGNPGWLHVTLRVKAAAAAGARSVNLSLGRSSGQGFLPETFGRIDTGGATTISSTLVRFDCPGRGRCEMTTFVGALAPDPGPAVHLDWTLEATWWPDLGGSLPPALRLTATDQPAPSPS